MGPCVTEVKGFQKAVFAVDEAVQGIEVENEPAVLGGRAEIGCGIVDFAFAIGELREEDGLFACLRIGFLARGLESFELGGVFLDGTQNPALELGERGEETAMLDPDLTFGERVIDFGVAGVVIERAVMDATGVDGVFDGAGALETPTILGDGLGQLGLFEADGSKGLAVTGAVSFEGGRLFRSSDVDLAVEVVFHGVETAAGFAGFGAWAGG